MNGRIVEVIREDDREIELALHGEDHTLANLIVGLAKKERSVVTAVYDIDHPLKGTPIVRIKTDGTVNPRDLLVSILRQAREVNEEFRRLLEAVASGIEA